MTPRCDMSHDICDSFVASSERGLFGEFPSDATRHSFSIGRRMSHDLGTATAAASPTPGRRATFSAHRRRRFQGRARRPRAADRAVPRPGSGPPSMEVADPSRARRRTGEGASDGTGGRVTGERRGGRRGWYGKIKSHFTRDGSRRHVGRSHEARPLRVLRGLGPVASRVRCRRACRRPCGRVVASVAVARAIPSRDPGPQAAAGPVRRHHENPNSRSVRGGLRGSQDSGGVAGGLPAPCACPSRRVSGDRRSRVGPASSDRHGGGPKLLRVAARRCEMPRTRAAPERTVIPSRRGSATCRQELARRRDLADQAWHIPRSPWAA